MTTEVRNKIVKFLFELNTEIDVKNFVDIGAIDFSGAFESIRDMIECSAGFDVEITYYSAAIEYLKEHDCSLTDSLAIADEYGYSVKDLNSELLASLLASQNARTEFEDLADEINEFFEALEIQ